jgi:hypothetical protein
LLKNNHNTKLRVVAVFLMPQPVVFVKKKQQHEISVEAVSVTSQSVVVVFPAQ